MTLALVVGLELIGTTMSKSKSKLLFADKVVPEWIIQSNQIENIYDEKEHLRSGMAWNELYLGVDKLTWDYILETHKQIMQHQRPDIAGKLRTVQVYVGDRKCPPPIMVGELMSQWLKQHAKANTWPKIKKAHIAFEHMHPFEDGNGRTGRMIMNWQRVRLAGLKPLCIYAGKRWDYYNCFTT